MSDSITNREVMEVLLRIEARLTALELAVASRPKSRSKPAAAAAPQPKPRRAEEFGDLLTDGLEGEAHAHHERGRAGGVVCRVERGEGRVCGRGREGQIGQ